jgi:mono/diheme cytochrome c family protein
MVTVCGVLLAWGCSRNEAPSPESKPAAPAQPAPQAPSPTPAATAAVGGGDAEAKKLFKARCVVCHGQNGKGDGPGAAALNPKPRDYTNAEWQKTVTDEEIAKTIVQGGAAVGKSPNMPPNPDLASKPEVVQGLVKVVRSFAQ